jgi:hypothetical protein
MKNVDTFYGHLVHVVVIWHILFPFGRFYGHLVDFFSLWYKSCTKKNLAALLLTIVER